MQEDNKNINYPKLAAKYLSGNATDAEVQQLETWVLSSPENKQQYLALHQSWSLAKTRQTNKALDVNEEWESFAEHLTDRRKVMALKPKRSYSVLLKVAAAAAVLVIAYFIIDSTKPSISSEIVFSENEIKEQHFPDDTQIALNQFSKATFFRAEDGTRQVELHGDAFFDVTRETENPFVIKTQDLSVEVLGTSFYVDSREDEDQIQVIVASGRVAMKIGEQEVILTKGEVGTYIKKTKELTEKQNVDANYMAWKTGVLIYEKDRLEKIIYDLNRTFHANVSLADPVLNDCTITASYKDKSLEAIIRIIEKTLTLKAVIDGTQIVISGPACN